MDPFTTFFAQMIPSAMSIGFDYLNETKREKQMYRERADQLKSLYQTASQTISMQEATSGFKTSAQKRKDKEYAYSIQELRNYF